VTGVVMLLAGMYFWIRVGHQIDARLAGDALPIPRIFGQPFEIYPGRGLQPAQLVQRLNDVGYAQRPKAEQPGEFSLGPNAVLIVTRPTEKIPSQTVTRGFSDRAERRQSAHGDAAGTSPLDRVTLEAPLLAAIAPGQKRRKVAVRGDSRQRESRRCWRSKISGFISTRVWIRFAWSAR
jgi:hypothetical protein